MPVQAFGIHGIPADEFLIHIHRPAHRHQQAAVGSYRQRRIAEIVTFFREAGDRLPFPAVAGLEYPDLPAGGAVRLENMASRFAECDVIAAVELSERCESAMLFAVPDAVYLYVDIKA